MIITELKEFSKFIYFSPPSNFVPQVAAEFAYMDGPPRTSPCKYRESESYNMLNLACQKIKKWVL